jgi:NAD(P)-dependent dehydrogenase (short-subunit alcohol dehydrogenase family)
MGEIIKNRVRGEWVNRCYVCHKKNYEPHFFYRKICKKCGEINYKKRNELCDLNERIALVTGGRIKIGYETALKLLRSGAYVIVTTRFPVDAAYRYYGENDFDDWSDRLKIYKVDFRDVMQIEYFVDFLLKKLPYLDILINNAAQTFKRSYDYFKSLKAVEEKDIYLLPEKIRRLIYDQNHSFDVFEYQKRIDGFSPIKFLQAKMVTNDDFFDSGKEIQNRISTDIAACEVYNNSWVARADQVSTLELLEVQLVNSVAPFVLCSKLKKLMVKSPQKNKFIVNVSAMEGKFSKKNKNIFHPHTNMAKAALNMLTRTIAKDYKESGIYVNSVDTGWITDENPHVIRIMNERKNITPPIDEIDGASRVCDPIFQGTDLETPIYGQFLKNYKETGW